MLGEKSRLPSGKGPSHNAAAEISKVSMAVASNKALALKASLTEMEVLEEQQRRLREQRDAQRRAQVLAQSALKPDRKTNGGIPSKGWQANYTLVTELTNWGIEAPLALFNPMSTVLLPLVWSTKSARSHRISNCTKAAQHHYFLPLK